MTLSSGMTRLNCCSPQVVAGADPEYRMYAGFLPMNASTGDGFPGTRVESGNGKPKFLSPHPRKPVPKSNTSEPLAAGLFGELIVPSAFTAATLP